MKGVPRSLLYVPAHRESMLVKAADRGADAIILDLEDSVPSAEKGAARDALGGSVRQVRRNGATVFVRVNADPSIALRDLDAACAAGVDGVMLPKVEDAVQVEWLATQLADLGARNGCRDLHVLLLVETARGLVEAVSIASAAVSHLTPSPTRWVGFVPGNEDLGLSLEIEPEPTLMATVLRPFITTAKAFGLGIFGLMGSGSDVRDLEAFRHAATLARRHGFDGSTCTHPNHIPVIHDVFAPSPDELSWARAVTESFERSDGSAIAVDGRMVDRPVYLRARRTLERASLDQKESSPA